VSCDCRKPQPGMLLRAAQEHAIDLGHSWLIGDILDDVEAGRRAGCAALLLHNGGETEWRSGPKRLPDRIAGDLPEAARIIGGAGSTP
jgi:D-glycero-D-manno-heptose 1,7-bisphosphate phosphatase